MLEELNWMDKDTRAKALNKIDLMVSYRLFEGNPGHENT